MLTDLKVRSTKARSKTYKIFDQLGLFLQVAPTGTKYWRFRYQIAKITREMSLGQYPAVTLTMARKIQADLRAKTRAGIDPLKEREDVLAASLNEKRARDDTFEKAVEAYLVSRRASWSPTHLRDVERIFQKELLPTLGIKRISEITKRDLKEIIDRIVARNALSFVRDVLGYYGIVIRHYNGYSDDLAIDHSISLRSYLPVQPREKHHNALPTRDLGLFLSRLRYSHSGAQLRIGLEILILTLVRTSELRGARWEEFDFEKSLWTIPSNRMKNRIVHLVPISRRVLELLRELRRINGDSGLLFKNDRSRHKEISENTFLYAVYKLGFRGVATPHGFRSLGSTMLNEKGFHRDAVERQLAHVEKDRVRSAYDRSAHWGTRVEMMEWWADFVEASETQWQNTDVNLVAA